ncbi:MAG TPA: maltotransferase domain-containing protein, partial [Vicinamibacterales bacterium]|nr:maltotransferase domain-containing protein [Vicinamibacterales bacterium]
MLIEHVRPQIDGGRFPIKRTPGEPVTVTADIFADGHDVVAAVLRYRRVPPDERVGLRGDGGGPLSAGNPDWQETRMTPLGNDAWTADCSPDAVGWFEYGVAAWIDRFASWHHDLEAK